MANTSHKVSTESKQDDANPFKKPLKIGAFISFAGLSAFGGFTWMLSKEKKKNAQKFSPKIAPIVRQKSDYEIGAALAWKALGRATVYAVTGFSVFIFTMWKLIGAKDLQEFSEKMKKVFPQIPKNENPEEIDWEELFKGSKNKEKS